MLQSFLQPSISLTQQEQPCFYNSRWPEGNRQLIAVNFLSLTTALAKKKKKIQHLQRPVGATTLQQTWRDGLLRGAGAPGLHNKLFNSCFSW